MIELTELRIGNIVKLEYYRGYHDVYGIHKGIYPTVCIGNLGKESAVRLLPVPLTDEILAKLGLQHLCDVTWVFPLTHIYVEADGGENSITPDEDRAGVCIHCTYLHELQNKYWAVTGEELKVDIDKL